MGCFNKDSSDIDLLIVVKDKLSILTKKDIINFTLETSQISTKKGIEMSIILKKELDNFKYSTPFELHYSETHREKYLNDPDYICDNNVDADLAAHITITIARGICLC